MSTKNKVKCLKTYNNNKIISAKKITINIQIYYNTFIKTFNTRILVLEILIRVLLIVV
jgi:hypothetical protein